MFIGHFAVGFGSKKFAPRTTLALLIAAPMLADLLWPVFLIFGWEKVRVDPGNTRFTPYDFVSYPWSHSLLMLMVWASLFAGIYYGLTRYKAGAVTIWIGVVSHWVLDWITHRPDMPLYPGGPRVGLGLWNFVAATMIVELLMFAVGIWFYLNATKARDWIGRYVFLAFVALLLFVYVSARFGAPPAPGDTPGSWSEVIVAAVILLWIGWFDHHRSPRIAD